MKYRELLKQKLDNKNFAKLDELACPEVADFVGEFIELTNPKSVFVRTDSSEDINHIREKAVINAEEQRLSIEGHTVHFDGYFDQARDKKNTKYLLDKNDPGGRYLNSTERTEGIREVRAYLKNIMESKEMLVCFFSLGPLNSEFSRPAVQITDSAYVAHSEDILYRPGYNEVKKKKPGSFFKFVHSAGELEGGVSKNTDKRRVYIDLKNDLVYSVNTQYAGNTVGLKKLALRLAINKASQEGWLAEHMFVMGVKNRDGRKAYFCGAYPSMCGKTSTAMVAGESIIGDDIAYLRKSGAKVWSANVERGIFGIIKDVNSKDDTVLFKTLSRPGEVIFSNVLIDNKSVPFWIGKDALLPKEGTNFFGQWYPGITDSEGNQIPPSHKNARYTIRLESLENVDEHLEKPEGVEVKGIIYGGRDSDTWPPIDEALSWVQGVITKGAALESETTAATLGQEGVRVFNPFSNMDFVSILLGKYIQMHLEFPKGVEQAPRIFSVNYFLKDKSGKFLNAVEDKRVWLKWARARVDGSVEALLTPVGRIPKYGDLKELFKEVLNKEYTLNEYKQQFTIRIPEYLSKIDRIRNIYKGLQSIPPVLFEELDAQEQRLLNLQKDAGDYVSPDRFKVNVGDRPA